MPHNPTAIMRLIFFGMPGRFAAPALRALLGAGHTLAAVVLPALPGAPPVTVLQGAALSRQQPTAGGALSLLPAPPSLQQLAGAHGVPLLAIRSLRDPLVAEQIAGLGADLACVACWPWRFPAGLLALPRHGFWNLHPALLPALRGPEPLFWALRLGLDHSGVTLHQMDADFDTGALLAQAGFDLPVGADGHRIESTAASLGAELLAQALGDLTAGRLTPRPQAPGGSYHPAPTAADFAIDAGWPAARAFRFMRGTAHWGRPYPLTVAGQALQLGAALGYAPDQRLGAPLVRSGQAVQIQLSPGVLTARLARPKAL